MPKEFITLKEFASLARHDEKTVRKWMKTGTLPDTLYTRPGGRVYLFDAEASRAWLKNQK